MLACWSWRASACLGVPVRVFRAGLGSTSSSVIGVGALCRSREVRVQRSVRVRQRPFRLEEVVDEERSLETADAPVGAGRFSPWDFVLTATASIGKIRPTPAASASRCLHVIATGAARADGHTA